MLDDVAEALLNGQQYTKNGRITVLKSNITYNSQGYSYKTDSLGRITDTGGPLTLAEAPRNEYAQRVAGRLDRRETDQGGHLIASRFNGSGNLDNLVAMDANLNQGEWRRLENLWADALNDGSTVIVNIKVEYAGISQRPVRFDIEYAIDGEMLYKSFNNRPGGL